MKVSKFLTVPNCTGVVTDKFSINRNKRKRELIVLIGKYIIDACDN